MDVSCPACGAEFEAPRSMKGGFASCPECRKAVEVPGGPEPLAMALFAGGAGLVVLATAIAGFAGGLVAGVTTFVVAALILGLAIAAL